jgi:4-amino-4-deoxy-L-arabinose transferase-like glycosyltransferase
MAWILLVVGIVHAVGVGWGLPASDGWDIDGVAPRDFLPGLAATFTPGRYTTYPPVHLAILAVLTLPIVIVAAARAPSLGLEHLVGEIIKVPYMTAIAYVARSVSVLMSLGVVFFLARIAEEIRSAQLGIEPSKDGGPSTDPRVRRAGLCTAAFVGSNASLTYYAHTSNLDVPYLFWATLALLQFTRALGRHQPRLLRRALTFAVLAVGTKDQAYGLFLLSLPVALGIWFASDSWSRVPANRRSSAREAVLALILACGLFILVDAVLFNPSGFLARVRFLTGSASQDFVEYVPGWTGRVGILVDAAKQFHLQYPAVLGLLALVGVLMALADGWRQRPSLALTMLPLLVALSFTILFNFAARRTNARFLLPQALFLGVYGGLAIDRIAFGAASSRALNGLRRVGAVLALGVGYFRCLAVDATMLADPRYEAEAWLASHVRPGDIVETYGLNVYLPRMPPNVRVLRVGPELLDKRSPMPGIEEVRAPFGEARARGAHWIVVSTGWVWRYIDRWPKLMAGQRRPPTFNQSASDKEATDHFDSLVAGDRGFKLVHESNYDDSVFPLIDVHGASGRTMWIYERTTD